MRRFFKARVLRAAMMFPVALVATTLLAAHARSAETRRVEGLEFDAIFIVGNVKVEVIQGDQYDLRFQGSERDLAGDPFYAVDGRLVLGKGRTFSRRNYDSLQFRVTLPELRELQVKGSGSAYVQPFALTPGEWGRAMRFAVEGSGDIKLFAIEGADLELGVKGSGDIKAASLNVEDLEAIVAGSGDLYIKSVTAQNAEIVVTGSGDLRVTDRGSMQSVEINVVGSGDVDLADVDCDDAEINIIGSGSAEIGAVRGRLNANVLGSGDVFYQGDPQVDRVELGSGEVRRR